MLSSWMARPLSTTEIRLAIKIIRRSFVRGVSLEGIVTGSGPAGKEKPRPASRASIRGVLSVFYVSLDDCFADGSEAPGRRARGVEAWPVTDVDSRPGPRGRWPRGQTAAPILQRGVRFLRECSQT